MFIDCLVNRIKNHGMKLLIKFNSLDIILSSLLLLFLGYVLSLRFLCTEELHIQLVATIHHFNLHESSFNENF